MRVVLRVNGAVCFLAFDRVARNVRVLLCPVFACFCVRFFDCAGQLLRSRLSPLNLVGNAIGLYLVVDCAGSQRRVPGCLDDNRELLPVVGEGDRAAVVVYGGRTAGH